MRNGQDFGVYPTSSFGYYRGTPYYMGEGAGTGGTVGGTGQFASGQGPAGQASGWEPSILYLFGLIIAEMIVFGILSRHLR